MPATCVRELHDPSCGVGDLGSIPGLGRSPGEGKGYPLKYSGLENSMGPWGLTHKESDTTGPLSLSCAKVATATGPT